MKMILLFSALVSLSSFTAFWASNEYKKTPVELSFFNTSVEAEKVLLKWVSISEQYASHAEIERSNDNLNFEKIGSVDFDAEGQNGKEYRFLDQNPFVGYNYYRLKMIDKDAQFKYSEVKNAYIQPIREITQRAVATKKQVKPIP
jgi:hypothetical protein